MTVNEGSHGRRWRVAFVFLLGMMILALVAPVSAAPRGALDASEWARDRAHPVAVADCPKPGQPDVDYLCPVGPTYLIPGLTDVDGWNEPAHFGNILTGDLDGDGIDELVARGTGGTQVFRFDPGLGQWSQVQIDSILSDHDGWDQPIYGETLRLGDIDGDGKAELVARSPAGIIVFRYARGTNPDVATWTQLTTSGPMGDPGWGADPSYYSTIQMVPLGRQGAAPAMQLMGRGSEGLELWRWNGNGWTQLATATYFSDQNGWNHPEYYSTLIAWDETTLLGRSRNGLVVYRYAASSTGPGSWSNLGRSSWDVCSTTAGPAAPRSWWVIPTAVRSCPVLIA